MLSEDIRYFFYQAVIYDLSIYVELFKPPFRRQHHPRGGGLPQKRPINLMIAV